MHKTPEALNAPEALAHERDSRVGTAVDFMYRAVWSYGDGEPEPTVNAYSAPAKRIEPAPVYSFRPSADGQQAELSVNDAIRAAYDAADDGDTMQAQITPPEDVTRPGGPNV
jgi:hypothetical protein